MSQLALYRAWRPQTFDDVVAQKQVVYPLKQAVISGDIAHAYLFAGTRGTGKTSMAKIFAKAVNCLQPEDGNPCNKCAICRGIDDASLLDVMEIDAASHNSVDNIRRITEEVRFMPSEARYKVYIIDEVHMLSQGAFNALLKTLEEPPSHAIFILATTEIQRIPATILSRCQRFEFRRIPLEDITARLREIAQADGIKITDEALQAIARLGDGALRDAISLLDQCHSGQATTIELKDVYNLAGIVQDDFLNTFTEELFSGNLVALLKSLEDLQMSGYDIQRFVQDFLRFLRDLLLVKLGTPKSDLLSIGQYNPADLEALAKVKSAAEIMGLIERISQVNSELRWSSDPKTSLELALMAEIMRQGTTETLPPTKTSASATTMAKPVAEPPSSPQSDVMGDRPPAAKSTAAANINASVTAKGAAAKDSSTKNDSTAAQEKSAAKIKAEAKVKGAAEEKIAGQAKVSATAKEAEAAKEIATENAAITEKGAEKRPSPSHAVEKPRSSSSAPTTTDLPARALWEACLDKLREQNQYAIVMLLKPAEVSLEDDGEHAFLKINYSSEVKAHYAALRREENFKICSNAVQEVFLHKQKAVPEIKISLNGEEEELQAENLNPEEPVWVQKLRLAGRVHQMEVRIPGIDDVPEADTPPSPPFGDSSLADEDVRPY